MTRPHNLALLALLAVLLGACALAVSACGDAEPAGERQPLKVVTTTTQVTDLARNVAGSHAVVVGLLTANADPHEYDVRPSDVRGLAGADVIVRSGGEVDDWLAGAISSARADARVIDLMDAVDAPANQPHWWHDPHRARRAVEAIASAFAAADSDHEQAYADGSRRYLARLDVVERAVERCVAAIPEQDRRLVTTHDAFGAYADRYGLEVVGTVIGSRSTHAQASAGDTAELVATLRRTGARAVFPDHGSNGRVERAIAQEAGVRLGPPLWTDALGGPGSGAETYLGSLAANTSAIVEGLTGERRSCGRSH